jgi:DUF917 family protein
MLIDDDALESISLGAAVLGAGGGGDPYIGKLMARQAIAEHGTPVVLGIADLPDDAFCCTVGSMGAPTVAIEKLAGGGELVAALRALEAHHGRPFTHLTSFEVGGMNSMLPIVAAAVTGLPLVDCDSMGRAFPELQMCTPTLAGIPVAPVSLADEKGNTVVLDAVDNRSAERLARVVTIEMGAVSYIALSTQTGAQVRVTMIPDTLALARRIGDAVRHAHETSGDPAGAVARAGGGRRLFDGKVADVSRRTVSGFARGALRIEGSGADTGSVLEVHFQNENLVAWRDGVAVATVPDLIVLVDADTGQPITTEEVRYGNRVAVLGLPCDQRWRTPEGLAVVGPRAFGYDLDHRPIDGSTST